MHVSMCAYIHACICMAMHANLGMHEQVYICDYICTCTYVSIHVCTHTYMQAEMNMCKWAEAHVDWNTCELKHMCACMHAFYGAKVQGHAMCFQVYKQINE